MFLGSLCIFNVQAVTYSGTDYEHIGNLSESTTNLRKDADFENSPLRCNVAGVKDLNHMLDMFHVDPFLEILGSITGNCAWMSTVFILQQLILLIVQRLLH